MRIEFDPKNRRKVFRKSVRVKTNGQPQETVLRIKGFIIPDPDRLGKHIGKLKVNRAEFNFGNIFDTEVARDSILVKNGGEEEMELEFEFEDEEQVNFALDTMLLKLGTGEQAYIYGTLLGDERGKYGFNRFRMRFKDKNNPQETSGGLTVTYSQEEDFSRWQGKSRKEMPRVKFERSVCDFGQRQQGEKVECEYVYSNTGGSELIIRDIRKSSFVNVKEYDGLVKPGESGRILLEVDLSRSIGNFIRYITVTTNCPEGNKEKLTIQGKVVDK